MKKQCISILSLVFITCKQAPRDELKTYIDSLTNGSIPYVFIFQLLDSEQIKGVNKMILSKGKSN